MTILLKYLSKMSLEYAIFATNPFLVLPALILKSPSHEEGERQIAVPFSL